MIDPSTINAFFIGGLIGDGLQVAAYIPQITHLYKEKDSTGLSVKAWFIWLLGDILLLAYSISIIDPVFIILTACYTIFTSWGIILILRFKQHKK